MWKFLKPLISGCTVYHQNHRSKSGQDGNKRDKRAQKAAAASKPVQEESWEMDDGVGSLSFLLRCAVLLLVCWSCFSSILCALFLGSLRMHVWILKVTPPPESEENENKDADDMKLDDVQQSADAGEDQKARSAHDDDDDDGSGLDLKKWRVEPAGGQRQRTGAS